MTIPNRITLDDLPTMPVGEIAALPGDQAHHAAFRRDPAGHGLLAGVGRRRREGGAGAHGADQQTRQHLEADGRRQHHLAGEPAGGVVDRRCRVLPS